MNERRDGPAVGKDELCHDIEVDPLVFPIEFVASHNVVALVRDHGRPPAAARLQPDPRANGTIAALAYDEELANRIRELVGDESGLTEKMFGGLAFLIGGNMAVASSGQG